VATILRRQHRDRDNEDADVADLEARCSIWQTVESDQLSNSNSSALLAAAQHSSRLRN
jgi:hypothetical protein